MLYKWALTETDRQELQVLIEKFPGMRTLKSPIFIDSSYDSEFQWKLEITKQNDSFIKLGIHLVKADLSDIFRAEYKIKFIHGDSEWCFYENKSFFHVKNSNHYVVEKCMNISLTIFLILLKEKPISITFEVKVKVFDTVDKICPKPQEISDFEKLFDDPKFSDFIIVCSEKEFNVHKNILAARSAVFSEMFELDLKEKEVGKAELESFTPEVVQELLRFMYCGKVNNLERFSIELLKAADMFAVQGLDLLCSESILKSINTGNALKLLSVAINYNADIVKSKIINFIVINLEKISKQPDFKNLVDPSALQEIITKTAHIWL